MPLTLKLQEQDMSTSRRKFLKFSAIAGGSLALRSISNAPAFANTSRSIIKGPKPMRILILGGTGLMGPEQVRYALSRVHKIRVLNRGKSHHGSLPRELEELSGDRNGQLDAL